MSAIEAVGQFLFINIINTYDERCHMAHSMAGADLRGSFGSEEPPHVWRVNPKRLLY